MTGPEHYREAERLAELATKSADREHHAALAQVHATLALAAATAIAAGGGLPWQDADAWQDTAGTQEPDGTSEVTR